MPHAAGGRAGGGSAAEEDVPARRTDDRRARVLRDHKPLERLIFIGTTEPRHIDPDRCVEGVKGAVDGKAPERRQRHACRTVWAVTWAKCRLAEENERWILLHEV